MASEEINHVDEEPAFEEIDTSCLESIKVLDDRILYPEFEAYWM